jgi:D-cysteine desulfhydrase family pyridoxal phosphate-dependent enzyme
MTKRPMSALTGQLPRVDLAFLPTPLVEMANLRRALGPSCPRLLIKRDDQTGLATGGNKTRKLEFLIGAALAAGADTVITTGGAQSNHCRQTAAAAARCGLDCVLVLSGDPVARADWIGNLLLDDLFGAVVRWAGDQPREAVIAAAADELRAAGRNPYVIPTGGSVPVGAAGYVAAVEEVAAQLAASGDRVGRMIVVAGSGGTHAGLLVGIKALGLAIPVDGMNNFAIPDVAATVRDLTVETAAFLGMDLTFAPEDFRFTAANGAHGYGVITAAEQDAIRLLARTEGILLDPVYTARAFGQMVAHIQQGQYAPDETLLFWHTGGAPGLLARAADLMAGGA